MFRLHDREIAKLIHEEGLRQEEHIELIASENFVSKDVLKTQGSILTNKYAEGYPGKRYYGGCEHVDKIEQIAIDRLKKLFGAEHANVQPHSGSQANMAVYMAVLEPGDKVLGMDLACGGHLTHGHKLSFSGKLYDFVEYKLNPKTEMIDFDLLDKQMAKEKPKLVVAGASAYSREIDFKKFAELTKKHGAMLMVDMAHIAGLCCTGMHLNPVPYADFVTTTTHKTLRGPRGGAILCKEKYAKVLDKTVFPGVQGGPLMHVIAAKAVAFKEAMGEGFKRYQEHVVKNSIEMAEEFINLGCKVVSDGTDNHMLMVDVKTSYGITGKEAEERLMKINITLNKNSIPFDKEPPMVTSGIRIGTAAMTSRGFNREAFVKTAIIIDTCLRGETDPELLKTKVRELIKHNAKHRQYVWKV